MGCHFWEQGETPRSPPQNLVWCLGEMATSNLAPGDRQAALSPAASLPPLKVLDLGRHESFQASQRSSCPLMGAWARDAFRVSGGLTFVQCQA